MGTTTEMLTNSLGESAGIGQNALRYIVGAATAVGLGIKSFQSIPEGSVGIKTKFGKVCRHKRGEQAGAPIIRGAGPRLTFPGIHAYKTVNVRHRSTDLETSAIELHDGGETESQKRNLQASITWRVSNEGDAPYRALFEIEEGDLPQMVTNVCLGGLRRVIEACGETLLQDDERLFAETQSQTSDWLARVGVVLEAVQLKDTTPSEAQILARAMAYPSQPDNAPNNSVIRPAVVAVPEFQQNSEIA